VDLLLETRNLRVRYGPIEAVRGVSMAVAEGEIVALVGPNGAGKSSLLRALMGLVPSTGDIFFQSRDLGRMPTHARVRAGLILVPEGRGILGRMSVQENLLMGAYSRRREANLAAELEAVYELFPKLYALRSAPGCLLSGGEQQMLAIGRALMARPRLLLLDEPSLGLAPRIVREAFRIFQDLHRRGTSILLVEQKAHQALTIASRAYLLENGRLVAEGSPGDLRKGERLHRAFLGVQPSEEVAEELRG
jgi:branched-chain amino acid transport system ATP-binding protein